MGVWVLILFLTAADGAKRTIQFQTDALTKQTCEIYGQIAAAHFIRQGEKLASWKCEAGRPA